MINKYPYDNQHRLYMHRIEIVRKWRRAETLEVSLNTETTHHGRFAFPVPSKTFVHYSFSEVCFNILTTQKMSERQGVYIHVVY